MCRNITFSIALMLLTMAFGQLQAQNYSVNFLKGAQQFESNIMEFNPASQVKPNEIFNNRYYRFVQFYDIPTPVEQTHLASLGIHLLEYIPNYVYVASIPKTIPAASLQSLNIRSIVPIETTYKMGQRLEDEDYPDWAMEAGQVIVSVQYYQDISASDALIEMKKIGLHVEHAMHHAQIVTAHIAPNKIKDLIQSPFIRYVDVMNEPGVKESDDGRHLHRANAIDGDYSGARNYDGTGMTFAINDDGAVGPHIDFHNRTNQQTAGGFGGTHGDMTTGIAGGAGNLDPLMRGMATGAWIHVRQYNASMPGTIPLHQDSAVLIFSSSYSNGCNAGYTNTTVLMDQEIYTNPNLMQTFSAGNSNNQDCNYGAGNQWGNITGGHKIGKNVIATANLNESDGIIASSSRGPASDGRIKPDISAHGNSQMSTDPDNAYAPGGGTSAAAPGICGVMTQMHHAYNSLNGSTAPSALLKAALLTTANDLGNDGPDFIYGWGKVNGLKAVKLLEDNRYFSATVSQGGSNTHNITIPAGVQRAKITVYWADKEASTASATALVNDLDATVTDPGTTIHLPWLLDHTPTVAALSTPATRGADHLNNIEQIAIDNPAAGTFVLDVGGTTVPFGPQEYWVVYEFLYDEITVIHPMGGEGLIPGTTDRIHWDAYGSTGSFLVEYTEDNGASWTTIAAAVAGTDRILDWTIPNTLTGQARVRITRGAASDESDANFSIIERPQNIRVNRVCPSINSIQIAWDSVPGATGYDVYILGFQYMDSIGSTSALNFNVPVADVNDPQWFSVRAVGPNGIRGLRQIAVEYPGATGGNPTCYLSCQGDNDAGVASLDAPGAIVETCGGATTTDVSMTIENIGLFTESNFPVYYQLDANPAVQETFTTSLTSGGSAAYTFATPLTIPSAGVYTLKTWTGLASDSTHCNDTITQMITILDPLTSFPYSEDFNGGIFPPPASYIQNADGDRTWEPIATTGAAGGNTTAMYVNNFAYNGPGEEDIFSFVTLDLTGVSAGNNAFMTFDVAYRRYNANFSDDLRVDLSTDCGQTFSQVYLKGGTVLATGGDATGSWAPNAASDWRNDTVDLSTYVGSNVTLRFVNINGYGNNLYVDNINVEVLAPLAPVADFTSDVIYTCDGTVNFTDQSGNAPTQWLWAFGDGGTSTTASPTYVYPNSGTYTVSLQVTNAQGVDNEVKTALIVVEYPTILSTVNGAACPNTPIDLTANVSNGMLHWYDGATNLIHVGDTFTTPPLLATTNYQVQNIILTPTLNVGPLNGAAVGGGGNHNSGFYGVINFTAYTEFELLSVWVDAGSAGNRTIYLWDGNIANGGAAPTNTVLDQRVVNLANGGQRVQLNFTVPGPGNYSIGTNNADLYRNNSGTSYPYTLANVLSMTSSAANNPSDFYYYFYDWQVRQDSCAGALSPITAEVVDANFTAATSGGMAAFTDASTGATSWSWDFGDGNTSTQQNPTHTFTTNGPHLVTLTINNGACSFMDSVSVSVGIEQLSKGMNVVLMPNPADDETTLRFSEVLPYAMQVEVIGVDGKILIEESIEAGTSTKTLDVHALPPAVYLIRLRSNDVVDIRKLVIGE